MPSIGGTSPYQTDRVFREGVVLAVLSPQWHVILHLGNIVPRVTITRNRLGNCIPTRVLLSSKMLLYQLVFHVF